MIYQKKQPIIPFFTDIDNMFNTFFNEITNASVKGQETYPHTNIYTETVDNKTKAVVEIAVAGFKKDELSITLENNVLVVKGTKQKIEENVEQNRKYAMKTIANRNFQRKVIVFDNIEKVESKIIDGILIIEIFEQKIEPKLTNIEIN